MKEKRRWEHPYNNKMKNDAAAAMISEIRERKRVGATQKIKFSYI